MNSKTWHMSLCSSAELTLSMVSETNKTYKSPLLNCSFILEHRTSTKINNAIVDIRLRPRCALPSPTSRAIGRIACAQNFPDSYLRLPGILNDPFCSERGSDGCSEDCQCFWKARTIPQTAPSPWDFVTLPEEDRATAIWNIHRKLVNVARVVLDICSQSDRQAGRQTDRQTHTHTHTHTDMLIKILRHRSRGRSIIITTTTR